MPPFEPVGDKARWRIIYEILLDVPTGDVVSYDALAEALELDPDRDRHTIQMAVRRAALEHLEADKRALEAIKNKGYRVVEAEEHLRLARGHQRKSTRQLMAGSMKVTNVDLSGLEPETKHAFEVVARAFALQMDFNRRFDVRQRKIEQAVSQITEQATRSEQEIADLRNRLERLESEAS